MTSKLTPSDWNDLLTQLSEPSALDVADAVAGALDLGDDQAYQLVEDALDTGTLVEDDAGAYGTVELAETSNSDDSNVEEPQTEGETPTPEGGGTPIQNEKNADVVDRWADADFATPNPGVYPHPHHDQEQWMGRLKGEKMPFSPWASKDHPEAPAEKDARYKWGLEANYADGDTVAVAEDDRRLGGRVFIQREDDPFAFVDGDDVRCPETGEVHPAFIAILEHLGVTYSDVSTSGGGIHAYYEGELPIDGKGQATFDIDTEPWGENDSPPAVEIYANKHVCVATGDHVQGTPTTAAEWDEEALRAILLANGYEDKEPVEHDTDHDSLDDYEPTATSPTETAEDMRDVYDAVDRLSPRDLPLNTSQTGEDSTGWTTWNPSYRSSSSGKSLHYNGEGAFHDHKEGEAFGVLSLFAAEEGIISNPWDRLAGSDYFEAVEAAREAGARIPEPPEDDRGISYRDDPREVSATVDPRRAWEAAGRVTPNDLDHEIALEVTDSGEAWIAPNGDRISDVVRAVAVAEGMIDTANDELDGYPAVYNTVRKEYGAPVPRYYTTADAIAEFDAVLDVIGEVTFWNLDTDTLDTEITAEGDDIDGDAVAALDPAWRESESGESVLVFDSGTVWDADTGRVIDALRLVALDAGLIDAPGEDLEGEAFTDAYQLARTNYGAPLPRWEPAEDGSREITPQLPPAEDLLDEFDYDGIDTDELEIAREGVEALIGELTSEGGEPKILTSLPATGKTTGTIKTAQDQPLSYLAPRKELQQQALDKAERWGVDAVVCPVFCDENVRKDVLDAAMTHVRSASKKRLRDRWALLTEAFAAVGEEPPNDAEELFAEEDNEDAVDLDRPTCETARGDHGPAWALAVHVARQTFGLKPREIHQHAEGLFGAPLPCDAEEGDTCEYTDGWNTVADPDDPVDLVVGGYVHAHVPSVRTHYDRGPDGEVERSTRGLVLDEFPGEAYTREFEEEAADHATWLARSLVDRVEDRRGLIEADLATDDWVTEWLEGNGEEVVEDTLGALERIGKQYDAVEAAGEILREVDGSMLSDLGLREPLEAVVDNDAADAYGDLVSAVGAVDPHQPGSGIARWADNEVREPLGVATVEGTTTPTLDGVGDDGVLPEEGDLRGLVDRAVEAVEDGEDTAAETVEAAVVALRGGREGCRRLAAWADDGYAHPDAHHLLKADITPTDDDATARRLHTDNWSFDEAATDGTVVEYVETGDKSTVVTDRNDHGAILHTPPSRESGGGGEVPLVGLDATGRAELWATALGEPVDTADIHTTERERAEFLESALSLRVIQAADRPRPYEGDPATKDTDGDVALLEAIAEEYTGIEHQGRDDTVDTVGKPAAITTKGVREVLENDTRLGDVVAEFENYGNVTGANDLGEHRLAAILGSQHYGDDAIERFCALAGEEVDTSRDGGRGGDLDYGSELGNTYLNHMREDQVMQAILRFARGDSGATVVARTSALRGDLPVVGSGQVVETWNDTATEIARRYRRLGDEFTVADVADAVDVSKRQVRRVLGELTEAGYLRRVEDGDGRAGVWEPAAESPGAGEAELPQRTEAIENEDVPGRSTHSEYYTWNVQVSGVWEGVIGGENVVEPSALGAPPSPTTTDVVEPPS